MARYRAPLTKDLFAWEPPQVAVRYGEEVAGRGALDNKIDARTIADAGWREGLRPEPQITVSEWADRFRRLPSTSAEPGRWRTDRTPYLREIMDALSVASPVERVVIMKGAQTGGTEAGLNFIGYVICNAPGLAMLVMPSIDMVRRNTRTRIDPFFEIVPEIAARVVPAKSREAGNTATHKRFTGGGSW